MLIGHEIKHYSEVSSTNDIAFKLADEGAEEGTVVTADFQTKGRGRQGRSWFCPDGQGLLFSVILKPDMLLEQSMLITLLSSIAVARTIEEISTVKPQIKWPNDILIDSKKICGILTEAQSEADLIKCVVMGIGLNVNSDIEDLPKGATSIKEIIGKHSASDNVLKEILKYLDHYYSLFKEGYQEEILEEYRHRCFLIGRQIKAVVNGNTIEGQAVDVNSTGALVVRLDTGFMIELHSPEVEMVR